MSNERDNEYQRQRDQQAQQGTSDPKRQAGQRNDDEKSPRGYDTKPDSDEQEKPRKGKIATSNPDDEESQPKRF